MPVLLSALSEPRVVLHGISWNFYDAFLKEIGEQHLYITYDKGEMELMSPLPEHEKLKWSISMLVEALAMELEIDIESLGSSTFRKESIGRGLEPDECYYIQHAEQMWNKRDLNFEHDPPPDLAIEIEVSRSTLDRQSVYAALGVPELWRYDGQTLRVLHLQKDGTYQEHTTSLCFPMLAMDDFVRFLQMSGKVRTRALVTQFRKWVRENLKKKQADN